MDKKNIREELAKQTYSIEKSLDALVAQIERTSRKIDVDPVAEYLNFVDEGRLIVIGGGSGLGKTAYVLQAGYELAKRNKDTIVIYASAEMMVEELARRLIANQSVDMLPEPIRLSDIPKRIKNGDREIVNAAKFILGIDNFFFINASRFNLEYISTLISLLREKNKDKRIFVIIDYLQLLMLDYANLNDVNTSIKSLKDVLVETQSNAIVIAALNRDSVRNDYVDMSAFKDSSMIEYTADIAMLLCFEKEKKDGGVRKTLKMPEEMRESDAIQMSVYCVKNRIGGFFDYAVNFDRRFQRFYRIENATRSAKNEKGVEETIIDPDGPPVDLDDLF